MGLAAGRLWVRGVVDRTRVTLEVYYVVQCNQSHVVWQCVRDSVHLQQCSSISQQLEATMLSPTNVCG